MLVILVPQCCLLISVIFFFNDTATTEIYTLSLHDALPISWGTYPLPPIWKFKKFDFAASAIYHTGFPFITVDQFGQLVSGPTAHRFPKFFTFNPAIERKFHFKGYLWAARIALNNVTNSANPDVVDNDVNSPTFLTFFGQAHRTLNGRIRFLGRQ